MEQNIQYLYEYQNGKRIRNLGFMKIEPQMDKCMIQIYAKDIDQVKGILFQKETGERYVGTWEAEFLEMEEKMTESREEESAIEPQEEKRVTEPQEEELQVEEYIEPSNVTYEKIQRQGLSRLPRKEWRIANNSFLLHGFYNYHHLLYIEDDGQVWIGVPGIYHEREKMAAHAFGFPEFRRIADVSVELNENEKNTYEDFGYWCRQVGVS